MLWWTIFKHKLPSINPKDNVMLAIIHKEKKSFDKPFSSINRPRLILKIMLCRLLSIRRTSVWWTFFKHESPTINPKDYVMLAIIHKEKKSFDEPFSSTNRPRLFLKIMLRQLLSIRRNIGLMNHFQAQIAHDYS